MIEIVSNRDLGDEHRDGYERCYVLTDITPYDGTAREFHAVTIYRYPCSSDQYTDTHVYAHGDDGDAVKE